MDLTSSFRSASLPWSSLISSPLACLSPSATFCSSSSIESASLDRISGLGTKKTFLCMLPTMTLQDCHPPLPSLIFPNMHTLPFIEPATEFSLWRSKK